MAAVPFAIAILSVWALVVLTSIWVRDYTELSIVTPVMLLAAGFMFGVGRHNGNGGNSGR